MKNWHRFKGNESEFFKKIAFFLWYAFGIYGLSICLSLTATKYTDGFEAITSLVVIIALAFLGLCFALQVSPSDVEQMGRQFNELQKENENLHAMVADLNVTKAKLMDENSKLKEIN